MPRLLVLFKKNHAKRRTYIIVSRTQRLGVNAAVAIRELYGHTFRLVVYSLKLHDEARQAAAAEVELLVVALGGVERCKLIIHRFADKAGGEVCLLDIVYRLAGEDEDGRGRVHANRLCERDDDLRRHRIVVKTERRTSDAVHERDVVGVGCCQPISHKHVVYAARHNRPAVDDKAIAEDCRLRVGVGRDDLRAEFNGGSARVAVRSSERDGAAALEPHRARAGHGRHD